MTDNVHSATGTPIGKINSDTKERIALIQRFIAIFGKDRIVNVFADREFIGEQWFTWLIEQDINFCIRVKKTSLSPII